MASIASKSSISSLDSRIKNPKLPVKYDEPFVQLYLSTKKFTDQLIVDSREESCDRKDISAELFSNF